MKSTPILLLFVGLFLSLASCQKKDTSEAGAQAYLSDARVALSTQDYRRAEQCIEQMRKDYPTALNAREAGILLLDSIKLAEAREQLKAYDEKLSAPNLTRLAVDTLSFARDEAVQKVRFFEKKIDHDKSNFKKH